VNYLRKIHKTCSKQLKKSNIKPVFKNNENNENNVKRAYFKLKMNGKDIATKFHSDRKCNKFINGLDIV